MERSHASLFGGAVSYQNHGGWQAYSFLKKCIILDCMLVRMGIAHARSKSASVPSTIRIDARV